MHTPYPDEDELDDIQAVTDEAVNRSVSHAKDAWRNMANDALYHVCRTQETLTVNDVRQITERSHIKTHDKRAMGGVIRLAVKNKWIEKSGDEIPSKQGHGVSIQIWKSLLFGKTELPAFFPSKRFVFGRYVVLQKSDGSKQCNCDGFRYRKTCSHIEKAEQESEPKLFI